MSCSKIWSNGRRASDYQYSWRICWDALESLFCFVVEVKQDKFEPVSIIDRMFGFDGWEDKIKMTEQNKIKAIYLCSLSWVGCGLIETYSRSAGHDRREVRKKIGSDKKSTGPFFSSRAYLNRPLHAILFTLPQLFRISNKRSLW